MDSLIKILRDELFLFKKLSSSLANLSNALKLHSNGSGVSSSVQSIEPILIDLSKLDNSISAFLLSVGSSNLKAFLDSRPVSVERDVALRLLAQIDILQLKTRHQLINSANLLVKSKNFIDYNVNVLSQTVSTNLYGPPGADPESPRRHRIFDANV